MLRTSDSSIITAAAFDAERLEVDDLQSQKAGKHDGAQLYAKDKRRMVALTEGLAERWKVGLFNSNILSCAGHGTLAVIYTQGSCWADVAHPCMSIPARLLGAGQRCHSICDASRMDRNRRRENIYTRC